MEALQPQVTPRERGALLLKKGLSHLHEAFADYMLMNPGATLREMGAWFGYNPSWICRVINSDMFKAYFAKRREGICVAIADDLPKKLEMAAHLATEKLIEMIPQANTIEDAVDVFDKILHRAGYAPNTNKAPVGAPQIAQQNNFFLSREELTQVQGTLIEHHKPQAPAALPNKGETVDAEPMPTT